MKKLIRGLREFKDTYVSNHRDFLEQLAHGQKPRVLFITCSDSRIVPSLITQTEPGEIFVIRNAGNIIPPFGAANGGEGAAVEYAIHALGIEQIIVCGHSHCGAMKGLLQIGKLEDEMPLVYEWLRHADATRRLVQENYQGYTKDELLEIAIAENVITQIENLKTYPVVHSKIYQGKLHIYGWVYLIETGEVLAFDPITHSYMPPQTQLDYLGQPGQYRVTQAPPVSCDVPPYTAEELERLKTYGVTPLPRQEHTYVPTPAPTSDSGNRSTKDAPGGISWLSPEQADRIYRGTGK
ncbi:MAG: carbonic anhydrase [Oscillatoriales cyanobacterium C42_A2020_001]|nr:carbonic anhydrase [Leptolyngbyaceae cyanobacterium C42_A2020_001]